MYLLTREGQAITQMSYRGTLVWGLYQGFDGASQVIVESKEYI